MIFNFFQMYIAKMPRMAKKPGRHGFLSEFRNWFLGAWFTENIIVSKPRNQMGSMSNAHVIGQGSGNLNAGINSG